jgi:hypothetical protein
MEGSSRRAFLFGGFVATAGAIADVVAKAAPASADDGYPVIAGQGVAASRPTSVQSTDTTYREPAFFGQGAVGLKGQSLQEQGIGVFAYTQRESGAAIYAQGRAVFTNSGRVQMPAGTKRIVVDGVAVNPPQPTNVLALLQTSEPGRWVTAAVVDDSKGAVTVILNQRLNTDAVVCWFAFSSDT